jgi:hypothetical protein
VGPAQVAVAGLLQATPFLQQAFPHGVVPAGHAQALRLGEMHATPARQQH